MWLRVGLVSLMTFVAGCGASTARPNARAAVAQTTTTSKSMRPVRELCAGAPVIEVRLGARDDQAFGGASLQPSARGSRESDGTSARGAKSSALTAADLAVLDRKGAWEEILDRADEIPTAQRGPAWERIVERAAVELLRRYADTSAFDAIFGTQAVMRRYPHLTGSRLVEDARSSAIRVAVDACLEDPRRGRRCVEAAKDWLKAPSTAAETTFEVARIVRKRESPYVAAPLFKAALDQKRAAGASAGTFCVDEDLRVSTAAALALPDEYDEAGAARAIAAGPCWDAMKDGVRATLQASDAPYFRDNACAVLRVKGAF